MVLEAIACGTRVAAFDSPGGTREILQGLPGEILVTHGDVAALADGLAALVASGKSTSPALPEEYRLPAVVKAYTDLFCESH